MATISTAQGRYVWGQEVRDSARRHERADDIRAKKVAVAAIGTPRFLGVFSGIGVAMFGALLSGCMPVFHGNLISNPDPMYAFDKSVPVLVVAHPRMRNELFSKYFIAPVVRALRARGFSRVLTERDLGASASPPGLIVKISAESQFFSDTVRSADYGQIQTGTTTNCTGYAQGGYGSATCSEAPVMGYGVTGYSDKSVFVKGKFFILWVEDGQTGRAVLTAGAFSMDEVCSEKATLRLLAEQAVLRMNFREPLNGSFSLRIGDRDACRQ